jgi:Ca2+-binding RTX toxin-like protein
VVTIASIETLNITSTNTDKSVSTTGASAINSLVASSAKTVNITAAGTTTLEATDFAAIVTINASASTAAVRIDLDDSSAVTFTGGAGNDRIDVHAITTLTVDDQLDGGAGSADVLATSSTSLDSTNLAALRRDTSNFERLEFDSTSSVSVDMADLAIFDTISLTGTTTAAAGTGAASAAIVTGNTGSDAKTITGIENNDTIIITAVMTGGKGESITGGDGGNAITLTPELDNGSNTVNITLSANLAGGAGGDQLIPADTGATAGDGGDAIYAATFETINLVTAQNSAGNLTSIVLAGGAVGIDDSGGTGFDGDAAGFSIVVNTNGTINVSGAAIDLNLGTISGTNATVNAGTYGGDITLVMEAGANTFIGGSGDDVVTGQGGLDTYTLGSGEDSVVIGLGSDTTASDAAANGTSFETITDFAPAYDEIRLLASNDTALTPTIQTDATASAGNAAIDAEGIATFAEADDTLAERITAVEDSLTGTTAGQMAVFEHGGNTYVFVGDGTNLVTAGDILVKLTGVVSVTGTTIDSSGYVTLQ